MRRRKRGGNLPPQFAKKKAPPFGKESKVEGDNARKRPDRMAFKRGGKVTSLADAELVPNEQQRVPPGSVEKQKYQFGGRVSQHSARHVTHGDPLRSRTITTRTTHRDRMAGEFKRGGGAKHKDGGHISAAGRRALPSGDFALPGQGKGPEGKGSGSYPIDTPGRARAALSRGAHNASPAQEATIRRKVKAKYPSMEVSD